MNLRRFLQRDVADPEELRVYLEATDKLSRAFAYFGRSGSTADQELRSIFVWIYRTPDEYLALLTQYKPHALLIFGFYSALLHRLNSVWWVKGRGTHLISLIYRQLDPYYRSLLRWPIEEIGRQYSRDKLQRNRRHPLSAGGAAPGTGFDEAVATTRFPPCCIFSGAWAWDCPSFAHPRASSDRRLRGGPGPNQTHGKEARNPLV
ncbi:C6 transcription factor, putative [Macrophomina phaseolina MS6]|uniref:C6 transcription factor, putative n=1 Tax=Macrophomina phaseolina (strain MS6) TaxID=1126212 RepID=K2S4Z3_MACPH|nr:C6 transcription factor, putative [Macrophomina phaseolina MS6]